MSEFAYIYDLDSLTEPERQDYIARLCQFLNIEPNLGLIMLGRMQDPNGGPNRLVPWIKRAGTEQIRAARKIDIISTTHAMIGDHTIMFTVTGKDASGHQEIAIGAKSLGSLTGEALTDAISTANTRANQRMTLQFAGAGLLSESEVQGRILNAPAGSVSKLQLAEAKPNNVPGKDITITLPNSGDVLRASVPIEASEKVKQEEFVEAIEREKVIAQLNIGADSPIEKKTRKARVKKVIDIGPSEPVPTTVVVADKPEPPTATVPAIAPVEPVAVVAVQPPAQPAAVTGTRSRLTPEQVKPYRQRLFRVVNDYLEPNGFAPKEGMGNADKMRALAAIQFPEVTNLNELTTTQWESYLSALETRIQKEGAAATVKYIEESIGI